MATHKQIAKSFATNGRPAKGHHMFHDGERIFSYGRHFTIACRTTDENSEVCYLMTTAGYSISTEKHKSFVRMALLNAGHDSVTYLVNNPDAKSFVEHYTNVLNAAGNITLELNRVKRARVYTSLIHAERMVDNLNAYCRAFKLNTGFEIRDGVLWSGDDAEHSRWQSSPSYDAALREAMQPVE